MKTLQRQIPLALAVLAALTLVACGGTKKRPSTNPDQAPVTMALEADTRMAPAAADKRGGSTRHYGVWLEPTAKTVHLWAEVPTTSGKQYTAQPISGFGTVTPATATYQGPATGYAHYSQGSRKHAGAISASVTLTATFGTTPDLTGTLDRFDWTGPARGGPDLSRWQVGLAGDGTGFTVEDVSRSRSAAALDDDKASAWLAAPYSEDATLTDAPDNIAGWFDVHFVDGRAVGAFDAPQRKPRADE